MRPNFASLISIYDRLNGKDNATTSHLAHHRSIVNIIQVVSIGEKYYWYCFWRRNKRVTSLIGFSVISHCSDVYHVATVIYTEIIEVKMGFKNVTLDPELYVIHNKKSCNLMKGIVDCKAGNFKLYGNPQYFSMIRCYAVALLLGAIERFLYMMKTDSSNDSLTKPEHTAFSSRV